MTLPLEHTLARLAQTPGARWWPQAEQLRHIRILARTSQQPNPGNLALLAQAITDMGWQLQAPDIGFRPLRPRMPWTRPQRANSTIFRACGAHWDTLDWAALAGEGRGMGWLALDWMMELGSVPWKQRGLDHEPEIPREALALLWWQALSILPLNAMGAGIPTYRMTHALAPGLAACWHHAHHAILERATPDKIARFYHWCGTYELGEPLMEARLLLGQEALETLLGETVRRQGQKLTPWESNRASGHDGYHASTPTFLTGFGPTFPDHSSE